MDGFVETLVELMVGVGVDRGDISLNRKGEVSPTLPGFFRATKEWDVVVVAEGELRVVVELKSQVGPSFGNNVNNRVEEAVGSAQDLWTAYREGAFSTSTPWLGYLFLLEDCAGSRKPVHVREPHFPVFPEFRDASYMARYELLCRRLVLERKYSAACFITARGENAKLPTNYSEPAADLSAGRFLDALLRHVSPPK